MTLLDTFCAEVPTAKTEMRSLDGISINWNHVVMHLMQDNKIIREKKYKNGV